MNVQTLIPAAPDLALVKGRQQVAWASGDYAVVGTTLQIVGETLCEAVDLRSSQRVLDVAAGNGNATLAPARSAGPSITHNARTLSPPASAPRTALR